MATHPIYDSEYNTYYKGYIDLAMGTPLLEGLATGLLDTHTFFEQLPTEKLSFRYKVGKWTPKEILLHLIDTERVFSYRALQFSRARNVVLPGFDQDEFVANSNAITRTMDSLLEEYMAVRTASIVLFNSFNDADLLKMGTASGFPLSVRAAGYILCGHEKHHINIIQQRYL
ncbi:MAG: DinB family protein [Marinirhabdus sp.]|nr:DinB family protein [Marinirhabdus sp.]